MRCASGYSLLEVGHVTCRRRQEQVRYNSGACGVVMWVSVMERSGGINEFMSSVVNDELGGSLPSKLLSGSPTAGDSQAFLVSAAVLAIGIVALASNAFV